MQYSIPYYIQQHQPLILLRWIFWAKYTKAQRYLYTHCVIEKKGILFTKAATSHVLAADSRTCLKSLSCNGQYPLFLRFSLCVPGSGQVCHRSVQFSCRIPSGSALKCLHFREAVSHLSKFDPFLMECLQKIYFKIWASYILLLESDWYKIFK